MAPAFAQSSDGATADINNKTDGVKQVVESFADAWNRHDMDAFSQLFDDDAEFVNVVGLWWKGKNEIRHAHEYAHSTIFKNSELTIREQSTRFPIEGIAISRAKWRLEGHVSPDGSLLPPRTVVMLIVLRESDGHWLIIDSQNTEEIEDVISRPQ
jgi:uncharacterized protein (TIGR02246 family)